MGYTQQRAMTLVEVLVATTLLGVGVTALLSAATLASRNQERSELRAVALALAQEKMSEIELFGPHVWLLSRPAKGTQERGSVTFSWSTAIEQKSVGELFAVQVTVEWAESGGGSTELATWLNDYQAKALGAPSQQKKPDVRAANTPAQK